MITVAKWIREVDRTTPEYKTLTKRAYEIQEKLKDNMLLTGDRIALQKEQVNLGKKLAKLVKE